PLLTSLAEQDAPEAKLSQADERSRTEITIAIQDKHEAAIENLGDLTSFTCPGCHGVLSALKECDYIRYRCHTGHAFSADTLLDALGSEIEESLWNAIRGIKESILLLNYIGDHYAERNRPKAAARFFQKAREAAGRMEMLEKAVKEQETVTLDANGTEGNRGARDRK
ncbi:MAG TPA: hypothetical protein VHE54_14890, partial [Puia sp.]|nr:hypothetical protein [Puia sp.]